MNERRSGNRCRLTVNVTPRTMEFSGCDYRMRERIQSQSINMDFMESLVEPYGRRRAIIPGISRPISASTKAHPKNDRITALSRK